MSHYRNPLPTVDIIIELPGDRIVLIRRGGEPTGIALPGGFIEEGETAEESAVREALEETNLNVELTELFYVYSQPKRDPRFHSLSVVYIARADGEPRGGDDAREAFTVSAAEPPAGLVFDHADILKDYLHYRRTGERPRPEEVRRR